MSRKVLLQLVLPLIGLSVLFWLLAFAPGDKHHQPALLEMSVILRDGDGNVSAMRKGMEQAAKDLNVELRFLTPAEDNSAVEQVQLLEHEVSGAAPAILLIPADREALGEAVSAAAGKILCKKGYVLRHICRRQRCAVLQNYRIIVRVTHIPRIELVLIQREIIVIAICPIIGICNAVICFLCHIHSRLLRRRYAQR